MNLGRFPDDKPILNQLPNVLACKIKIKIESTILYYTEAESNKVLWISIYSKTNE
jgi:hypothetical protein